MTVLQFLRPTKKAAVFTPTPGQCRCLVKHLVDPTERNLAISRMRRAAENGDTDTASFLRLRLATTHRCPAYVGPLCPCGCGRTPGQHNPMNGDAA